MKTPRWEWTGARSAEKKWPSHGLTGTIRHINHFWFRWEIRQYGEPIASGSKQGRSEVVAEANRAADEHLARQRMHVGVYTHLMGWSD